MNELAQLCINIKKDFTPKIRDPTKPVRCWFEKDFLDNKIVDTYVIIFRTRGCSWALKSGCTMCGYFNDSMWGKISDKDFSKQFDNSILDYSGEKFVKIFTSGSFLDDSEVNPKIRKKILNNIVKKADKISVESRPEYVTDEKLSEIKEILRSKKFEVGIGLETANDNIRENSINKGFAFSDYIKAAKTLKKYDFELKTYVLIKPPFLTEKKSIEDAVSTVCKIKNLTDIISFNPTNIQKNTLVDYLWKHRQYRPAWLWSVVEIIKESKKIVNGIRIKCDIVGGGTLRGAYNCKECNKDFVNSIADFSLSQNTKVFDNLKCECVERWRDQLEIEEVSFGSIMDI
ncbi:MAG: archaeosine biosynthesis radical SAM protein RaSEA [Thermoplasmatales archaeon]|nr:MAG: archaeosine biosynthesis radical SAM protein RaSEA [Thermoplasmatales archaeon]